MELVSTPTGDLQNHITDAMGPSINKVTVGAAILGIMGHKKEVLLLKRNADEPYYPHVFEMPGGKTDDWDTCIRDALDREVAEETGLTIRRVIKALPPMTYTTSKMVRDVTGNEVEIVRHAVQISYAVQTYTTTYAVNKEEHSEGPGPAWKNWSVCP